MSFWGDIEHAVKDAAQLDPTVLTAEAFERAFLKHHKRKPKSAERAQWEHVKAKYGVAGVGAAEQPNPGGTQLDPVAKEAMAQGQAMAQPFDWKTWAMLAALAWFIVKGR